MITARPIATTRPLGALELKRSYQHNLIWGLMLAAGLHLAVVGGILLMRGAPEPGIANTGDGPPAPGPIVIRPPVTISTELPLVGTGLVEPPKGIIPRPVADVEVKGEVEYTGLRGLLDSIRTTGTGGSGVRTGSGPLIPGDIVRDTFPAIDQVLFDVREPVAVLTVAPIYPVMAERAGLTGNLVIRVLVDQLGRVQKAVVIRCSAPGLGFEEAAREALLQWVFTPAQQNGHPVSVWINLPVQFESN